MRGATPSRRPPPQAAGRPGRHRRRGVQPPFQPLLRPGWVPPSGHARPGYFRDQREIQGVGVTFERPCSKLSSCSPPPWRTSFARAGRCSPRSPCSATNSPSLQRSVARPRVTRFDRIVLVALAAVTPTWRNVLRIVQPETLLRWHRAGFKALWRWRSRTRPASRLAAETAALIRSMASANRLWGAERIRGELLKLGVKVSKRTIQKYMRAARPARPRGQRWSTFLRNHAQRDLGLRLSASL